MKMVITIMAIFLGVGNMLNAQVTTGTIMGKVYQDDSTTVLPGAKVWIDTDNGVIGVMCDVEGRFKMDGLKPGIYNVHAKFAGLNEKVINEVKVSPDGLTKIDFSLSNTLGPIDVITYKDPLITSDIPKIKISTEDIAHSPNIRNPLMMLAGVSSDIQVQEGSNQVIIRGSRPGDAVYYIDGVKMTDMGTVPGVAIGSVEAYTGGVPAKYGDTTGGVVSLETKSYFDLYNAWLARQ